MSEYVYHLTALGSGSGDAAFLRLVNSEGFMVHPLADRVAKLSMPVTAIFGAQDRVVLNTSEFLRESVKGECAVFVVPEAGHHA